MAGISSTDDDDELLESLEEASRALDEATFRRFYPRIETRYFSHDQLYDLRLDDDLLSLTSLTTYNGDTTIPTSACYLLAGDDYNLRPARRIELDRSQAYSFGWSGTPQRANTVTGVWGYHRNYDSAYTATDTVQSDPLTAIGTTLAVSDGDNFQRGQTLRIGDEWLYVSDIATNNLTVERGLNGSTAAEHAADTVIYVYNPPKEAVRVALRYAAWLYGQRQAPFSYEVQTDQGGNVIIPQSAPSAVHRFIRAFRRLI